MEVSINGLKELAEKQNASGMDACSWRRKLSHDTGKYYGHVIYCIVVALFISDI